MRRKKNSEELGLLQLDECSIGAVGSSHQIGFGTTIDDLAVFKKDDEIGASNGRQAMSDDDDEMVFGRVF